MSTIEQLKGIAFRSARLTAGLRGLRTLLHYLRGTPHEREFAFLRDPHFAGGVFLDLGANIGQSALSANAVQPTLRILSLEPNPACEPGLKMAKRLLGNAFQYRLVGVGAELGTLQLYVPVRNSRMLLEEGTLERKGLETEASRKRNGRPEVDFSVAVIDVAIVTVDSLDVVPTVVKMDLQGLELAALQGMRRVLRESAPTLMVERGRVHADVVRFLSAIGYDEYYWDGARLERGEDEGALNSIFLPPRHALRSDNVLRTES